MSSDGENLTREIVIVRRRKGGGEEGHHGGAWKIAFADFMTAMMAFFLVMWLVNMTDDKTVTQIANYFNPLQLTDRSPTNKGIRDADAKAQHGTADQSDSNVSEPSKAPISPGKARMERARKEKAAAEEAKLFVDPMKTLEEAASVVDNEVFPEKGANDKLAGLDEKGLRKEELQSGPDLFDPFDPRIQANIPRSNVEQQPEDWATTQSQRGATTEPKQDADAANSAPPAEAPESLESKESGKSGVEKSNQGLQQPHSVEPEKKKQEIQAAEAKEQANRLVKALVVATRTLNSVQPSIAVEVTAEGLLVTIMENESVEMFRRGSAEPLPATVKLIDQISAVLKSEKGQIVVRGHTDSAQFKTSAYDNWRLSTARAHMAHYMLRRGGIPDSRIQRDEGWADNELRNKDKPLNPENRRIELLLKVPSV